MPCLCLPIRVTADAHTSPKLAACLLHPALNPNCRGASPQPAACSNGAEYSWTSCEYWDATAWSDAADAVLASRGIDMSKFK